MTSSWPSTVSVCLSDCVSVGLSDQTDDSDSVPHQENSLDNDSHGASSPLYSSGHYQNCPVTSGQAQHLPDWQANYGKRTSETRAPWTLGDPLRRATRLAHYWDTRKSSANTVTWPQPRESAAFWDRQDRIAALWHYRGKPVSSRSTVIQFSHRVWFHSGSYERILSLCWDIHSLTMPFSKPRFKKISILPFRVNWGCIKMIPRPLMAA